jgi:hypothetical protein
MRFGSKREPHYSPTFHWVVGTARIAVGLERRFAATIKPAKRWRSPGPGKPVARCDGDLMRCVGRNGQPLAARLAALQEPERRTLTGPIDWQIGDLCQSLTRERCRLPSFHNGLDNAGVQCRQPQQKRKILFGEALCFGDVDELQVSCGVKSPRTVTPPVSLLNFYIYCTIDGY